MNKKSKKNKVEVKSFFHNIVCELGFVHLPKVNEYLENLFLLLRNRNMSEIFMVSSN